MCGFRQRCEQVRILGCDDAQRWRMLAEFHDVRVREPVLDQRLVISRHVETYLRFDLVLLRRAVAEHA